MAAQNEIRSVKPEFGVNYKPGYIGFTFVDNSIISKGIAWFTRWDRGENPDVPDLSVSHVFIASGDGECIEAHEPKILRSKLSKYFDDPHTHVVFRKPVGLTLEVGAAIARLAGMKVGLPYNTRLIIGQLLTNSLLGRLVGTVTFGWSHKAINWAFNKKGTFICSQLAAFCLSAQPEYNGRGILAKPDYEIDPQEMFEDRTIFEPWAFCINGSLKAKK